MGQARIGLYSKNGKSEPRGKGVGLRCRMLLILVVAGIPGILIALFLTVERFSGESARTQITVERLAALGAAQHESVLARARVLLKVLVRTPALQQAASEDCRTYFNAWRDDFRVFTTLTLFDTKGQVICTTASEKQPVSDAIPAWFRKAMEDKEFTLSDYVVSRDGTPIIVAADAIRSQGGEVTGVAAIGISRSWLDDISASVNLPKGTTLTAVSQKGVIITHFGGTQEEGDGDAPVPSSDVLRAATSAASAGTVLGTDASGATRIYGYRKTGQRGLTIIAGRAQFFGFAEWREALYHTLVAPLIVLFLALAAAAWASEALVVRHIRSLIATTDEIAEGHFEARSDVDYDQDELGELAAALDSMAETLEQEQAELQQELDSRKVIVREMQHRINNSLSLVQALARQTHRYSRTREEFISGFDARLQSLAASNDYLARHDWKDADLFDLLKVVLNVHRSGEEERLILDGPEVTLNPTAAMALSLTMHELATNAIKYGALTSPEGCIHITWSVGREANGFYLRLDWRETGGPVPDGPRRTGFGSRLIRMMIEGQLRGEFKEDYRREGYACTILLPSEAAVGELVSKDIHLEGTA